MFKTAKEFTFDMAHMLDGHDGKCQNLHGHTYILQVEISGSLKESGAKKGMVMDFSDLKNIVKTHILDKMDHAFIKSIKFKNLWYQYPQHCRRNGSPYFPNITRTYPH